MTAWWHALSPGEQYVWAACIGTIVALAICLAWEWISGGMDNLDVLLWEAELDEEAETFGWRPGDVA